MKNFVTFILIVIGAVASPGCQTDPQLRDTAMHASQQVGALKQQLQSKIAAEDAFYASDIALTETSAPTARRVDFEDTLTRASRSFVSNVNTAADPTKPTAKERKVLSDQVESFTQNFVKTWQDQDMARQKVYDDAITALNSGRAKIVVAQAQLDQLQAKLKTMATSLDDREVLIFLMGFAKDVKDAHDKLAKDAKNAETQAKSKG